MLNYRIIISHLILFVYIFCGLLKNLRSFKNVNDVPYVRTTASRLVQVSRRLVRAAFSKVGLLVFSID